MADSFNFATTIKLLCNSSGAAYKQLLKNIGGVRKLVGKIGVRKGSAGSASEPPAPERHRSAPNRGTLTLSHPTARTGDVITTSEQMGAKMHGLEVVRGHSDLNSSVISQYPKRIQPGSLRRDNSGTATC